MREVVAAQLQKEKKEDFYGLKIFPNIEFHAAFFFFFF